MLHHRALEAEAERMLASSLSASAQLSWSSISSRLSVCLCR